ncbi:hypothetical protein [Bartonella sp. B39]
MHNPFNLGTILKDELLYELGLTITEFANHLGVAHLALLCVLNYYAVITALI